MTDMKPIVAELNRRLHTDYNLITFDALGTEQLLQTLLDVLHDAGATPSRHTVRDADPADTNQLVVDALKRIQYRADQEPATFRSRLLQADRTTVHAILAYVFEHAERIKEMCYLAQFLIPLQLPPEALAAPEIAALWQEYNACMHVFKETHRSCTEARQENAKLRELRQDIAIMEAETETVRKRIEHTQTRLDRIPQAELMLEAARALRMERDRRKELEAQLAEQQALEQKDQVAAERAQKELASVRATLQDTTPQQMLDTLVEQTQVDVISALDSYNVFS